MLNMIIRGRAVLEAQQELQNAIQDFYRGVEENKIIEARRKIVNGWAQELEKGGEVPLWDNKDQLNANYLIYNRKLMLRMHECFLSLKYRYSREDDITIPISPYSPLFEMQTTVDGLDDLKQKQAADVKNKGKLVPIIVSTESNVVDGVFSDDWSTSMNNYRKIPFQIPIDFKRGSNHYDIRVNDIK
jgi:hypothetical protein